MRKLLLTGLLLFTIAASAQQAELLTLAQLKDLIDSESSSLKVINFWASWCGPCVKEMPYLDEIGQKGGVELYFVSVDFASQKERADKILAKKGIQSKAFLLNEKNADNYIPHIHKDWSGAIPATLFVKPTGQKIFYERALEKEELEKIVENLTSK